MSDQSVARQYANALFTVVDRHRRNAEVGSDLTAFANLVAGHPELKALFESPVVTPRQKRVVMDAILALAPDLSGEVQRLLTMMADRDRLALVGAVAVAFNDRVMEAERAVDADVVTAMPLAEESQAALAGALGRATGRRVTVRGRVDPSVVGGIVARVGSLVFDGSIAGQLTRMKQRITAGV